MYLNCMIDVIILAQDFVDKIPLLYKMPKLEKGDNSFKYL